MMSNTARGADNQAINNQIEPIHRVDDKSSSDAVKLQAGKTAIGSNAADTGNRISSMEAEKTMSKLGQDGFHVHDGGFPSLESVGPSEAQRKAAEEKLQGQISKLLPKEDQEVLKSLQKSVLDGDVKQFGATVAKLGSDPERRKAFIDEMNKNLAAAGSSTRAEIDSKGNIVLHNGAGTGVVFSPDGKATVHKLQRVDGGISVGGEVIGGRGVESTMSDIGNRTVFELNGIWQPGFQEAPVFPIVGPIILNRGRHSDIVYPGGSQFDETGRDPWRSKTN